MHFGFSEEQNDVKNLAKEILSAEVTTEKLAAYDDHREDAAAERFDRDLWAKLAEAGLLGVAIEEQYGGMGFGYTELALMMEEVGRVIAPIPAVPHLVSAALPLQVFGSDEQKQRLLPGAASGKLLLSAAIDARGVKIEKQGDDLTVNGSLAQVAFANSAERILVLAPEAAFLLDPNAAGVSLVAIKSTTGEPQSNIELKGVVINASDVVATGDKAKEILEWTRQRTQTAICAYQTGIADHCTRMTASYTAERKQFGVPVATFQAVGHRAANCFIDTQLLQLTTYQAVSLLNSGHDATNEVAIAKIWAGDAGHRISYASQHLHGGTGIDRDYPLWRFCTWLRQNEMTLGSTASQLAVLGKRVAAGHASFA